MIQKAMGMEEKLDEKRGVNLMPDKFTDVFITSFDGR